MACAGQIATHLSLTVGMLWESKPILTNMRYSRGFIAVFPNARACHRCLQPGDIKSPLKSLSIDNDFSVLCLDVDGNDYWILAAILASFRPRLIVTEINEKIPPPIRFAVKYDPAFNLGHHFYGYSIAALADLCARSDYGILRLEYNNAFIAPRELTGDLH